MRAKQGNVIPGVDVLCWLGDYWDEPTHLQLLPAGDAVLEASGEDYNHGGGGVHLFRVGKADDIRALHDDETEYDEELQFQNCISVTTTPDGTTAIGLLEYEGGEDADDDDDESRRWALVAWRLPAGKVRWCRPLPETTSEEELFGNLDETLLVSADGQRVAVAGGPAKAVFIVKVDTGEIEQRLATRDDAVAVCHFDATEVVALDETGHLDVLPIGKGKPQPLQQLPHVVKNLVRVRAEKGRFAVAVAEGKGEATVAVWEKRDGAWAATSAAVPVTSATFIGMALTPDGEIVTLRREEKTRLVWQCGQLTRALDVDPDFSFAFLAAGGESVLVLGLLGKDHGEAMAKVAQAMFGAELSDGELYADDKGVFSWRPRDGDA